MKSMNLKKMRGLQALAVILTVLITILFFIYIFFVIPHVSLQSEQTGADSGDDRKYHILVVGDAANEAAIREIQEGAEEESKSYNCVVELNVPSSGAEDRSLQEMLDFASFAHVDGVIAYIGEGESDVFLPDTWDGKTIPLITISQYEESIPQISYIGTNYSELGRKIASESAAYLSGGGNISLINTNRENNPNYSTLMASLTTSLSFYSDIYVTVYDLDNPNSIMSIGSPLTEGIRTGQTDLVVCLTSDDTICAAQLVNDLGKAGKTGIIGFGEGSVLDRYLEVGIVTELLSIDSKKIGSVCLRELFEYIHYGYANSYIAADVKIRKRTL